MTAPVYLIGYGTLLHRGSLGHSIGHGAAREKRIIPVVVRGYRRLFNLRPDHYESSHKLGGESIEDGAMNLEPAEGHEFNGLAFAVTAEEIAKLDRRECYYERRKLPMESFASRRPLGPGFAYVAPLDAAWLERDPRRLMPLWRDVVWARQGAYGISPSFGRMFDHTTFLADGRTRVVDRYREVLSDTDDIPQPGIA